MKNYFKIEMHFVDGSIDSNRVGRGAPAVCIYSQATHTLSLHIYISLYIYLCAFVIELYNLVVV